MSDLSPYELNRRMQQSEDRERRLRRAIQETAEIPNEIHTVMNCACGVSPADGGKTILQVVKADGTQLHIVLKADARRALIGGLVEEEEKAEGATGLELPGP